MSSPQITRMLGFAAGFCCACAMPAQARPRMPMRTMTLPFIGASLSSWLLPELRAETEEDGELRQAVAFVRHGPLRFHEAVEDGRAGLEHLAGAEAERDEVVVGFQVEGPRARRAQVPA